MKSYRSAHVHVKEETQKKINDLDIQNFSGFIEEIVNEKYEQLLNKERLKEKIEEYEDNKIEIDKKIAQLKNQLNLQIQREEEKDKQELQQELIRKEKGKEIAIRGIKRTNIDIYGMNEMQAHNVAVEYNDTSKEAKENNYKEWLGKFHPDLLKKKKLEVLNVHI